LYWGFTAFVATDNLPSKNHAFGPNAAYLLENLNATFPQGYDVYLYTQMWSFGTGTGSDIVVDDNSAVYGRGYNGHGPAWTGNVANLGLNMTNQAYDANEGFVEGDNFVKLLGRTEDTLNFQPYPNFGPFFNSVGITGIQVVGVGVIPEPTLPSDLTNNGFVDFQDLTILLANWNKEVTASEGNLVNADTTPVNFQDLTVLLADWTGPGPAGSPEAVLGEAVPEPSSLLLALLATLGLSFGWRRRRRAF
jgi:hypothetical protein